MRPQPSYLDRAKMTFGKGADGPLRPLTRKEFYDLSAHCRAYAQELARNDQTRVSLKHCHEFNRWLPSVKSYDLLAPYLATLRPARPIARWQVLILALVVGLFAYLFLGPRMNQMFGSVLLYVFLFSMLLFAFFVPERLYGTTIELLEAKVLRVVEALEDVLQNEDLGFTEAVYFQVKDNLHASRSELRQQIDLAHRRWR